MAVQLIYFTTVWIMMGLFQGDLTHIIKDTQYKMMDMQKGNYTYSREVCQGLGEGWDLPDDTIRGQNLSQFKVSQFWLVYQRVIFPQFTWLNGIRTNVIHLEAGGACGGLSVAIDDIQSIPCAEKGVGYICQLPSGTPCPSYFSHMCVQFDDFFYITGCGVSDWYDGQSLCSHLRGRLAILDTEPKKVRVLSFIKRKTLYEKCGWMFLGLIKEQWKANITGANTQILPRNISWTHKDNTGRPNQDCLVYSSSTKTPFTSDCTSQQHSLCQYYGDSPQRLTEKSTDIRKIDKKVSVAVLGTLTAVLILCLCTFIFLCYRIQKLHFKHKWKTETKRALCAILSAGSLCKRSEDAHSEKVEETNGEQKRLSDFKKEVFDSAEKETDAKNLEEMPLMSETVSQHKAATAKEEPEMKRSVSAVTREDNILVDGCQKQENNFYNGSIYYA